jgi:hypothetical protein
MNTETNLSNLSNITQTPNGNLITIPNFVISENPLNQHIYWDIIPDLLKVVLSLPYQEQGTKEWLKERMKGISASEVNQAIDHIKEGYDTKEDLFGVKTNTMIKRRSRIFKICCDHGHEKEPVCALKIAEKYGLVLFSLGSIPHADSSIPLRASLDRISINLLVIEIKCPRFRFIIPDMDLATMKEELPHYYDQCQAQLVVIRSYIPTIGYVLFVQYGTAPNPHYLEGDFMSELVVPYDPNWLEENREKMDEFWKSVLAYRAANPDWETDIPTERGDPEMEGDDNEEQKETRETKKRKKCPFPQQKVNIPQSNQKKYKAATVIPQTQSTPIKATKTVKKCRIPQKSCKKTCKKIVNKL